MSSSRLKLDRVVVGPIVHVRLKGVVDESFSPTELAAALADDVVLDLGGIERITSFGVREWMRFMKQLPQGVTGIYVINAPVVVVDQLSMVEGFAGVAKILSILAPYSCEKCAEDRLRLVDLRADSALYMNGEAPPHNCPVCASPLVFADSAEQFFSWPKQNPVGEVAPVIDHYLRTISAPQQTQLTSHVKVVEGDVTYVRIVGVLGKDLNPRRVGGGLDGTVAFDLGHVTKVEPQGIPKLIQAITAASESAKVYLWRAPQVVLEGLVSQPLPIVIRVATVQLNAECLNCGQAIPNRQSVSDYVRRAESGQLAGGKCSVCGGKLRLPMLSAPVMDFLRPSAGETAPSAEFDALEPRALSQYLSLTTGPVKKRNTTEIEAPGAALNLQVLRRIGRGGMAEVFLARQVGLKGFEKYVCLKKILPQFASRPDFVEMLFAEARSSARLTHPNIVQIYDVGMLDGSAYITMEYVRGADLRRLMVDLRKKNGRLPLEHAVRIIAETASGLDYAHRYVDPTGNPHPVVHRDVSPHNILVSFEGAIKLSDFGIAKAQGDSEHTEPGMIKGKVAYLPPETIQGKPPDGRGDVFSLGVSLYDILTLRMPFRRESDFATLHAIVKEDPPDPREYNPLITPKLSSVVLKSMAKNPDERYQTAGEFREELEASLAEMGLHSSPASVALFFQQQLGELVAELGGGKVPGAGPVSRTDLAAVGSGTGSSPTGSASRVVATTPPPPRQLPDEPEMPVLEADPVGDSVSMSMQAPEDPTNLTPVPLGDLSQVPVPPDRPPPPVGTPTPERGRQQAAPQMPVGSRPTLQGSPAVPAVRVPPPVAPPAQPPQNEAVVAAKPKPAAPVAAPPPAATPPPPRPEPVALPPVVALPPAPLQPVAAPPPEAPPAAAVAAPSAASRRKWMIPAAAVAALLLVGGGGFALMKGMSDKLIHIINLEPDERVYASGVRVEGGSFKSTSSKAIMIGVARQGQISRLGSTTETEVDIRQLPEVSVAPGEQASMSVSSDPKGCSVIVGGTHQTTTTPLATSIPAGREVNIEVMCPGLPRWTRMVMAGPGQSVQLSARMFDGQTPAD